MRFDRPAVSLPALLRLSLRGGVAGDPGPRGKPQTGAAPDGIYQRPSASKAAAGTQSLPHLLGRITIERVNQVRRSDVTPA
jgi:hypothetical protein